MQWDFFFFYTVCELQLSAVRLFAGEWFRLFQQLPKYFNTSNKPTQMSSFQHFPPLCWILSQLSQSESFAVSTFSSLQMMTHLKCWQKTQSVSWSLHEWKNEHQSVTATAWTQKGSKVINHCYDNQSLIWVSQHLNIKWKYSDHFQCLNNNLIT